MTPSRPRSPRFFLVPSAAAVLWLSPFGGTVVRADDQVVRADAYRLRPSAAEIAAEPANLAGGLRQLSAAARKAPVAVAVGEEGGETRRAAAMDAHRRATVPRAQADADGRVVVDVRLQPGASNAATRATLESLGAEVLAESAPAQTRGGGVLSTRLHPTQAAEAARLTGVRTVKLVHRPWRRAGRVTSEGTGAIQSNTANRQGFTGRGITVGVLSDSYDRTRPRASEDVKRDDLPGKGNKNRHTRPVLVLEEGPPEADNVDEGRAMLEIVHDVAPDAALAFATAGLTQTTFANNIRALRTVANCDVIVDDIAFPDEPFFSDGLIARAVDEVVTSADLPGRSAIFYSAAGNYGGVGYDADFQPVPDAQVRAGQGAGNLKLNQVPVELTAGGFHNFDGILRGSGVGVAQPLIVSGDTVELNLQWNDPFGVGGITSGYNLLVFDADGNFLPDVSGLDNNFRTDEAIQLVDLDAGDRGASRTYQIAITRRAEGAGTARHLRYIVNPLSGNVRSDYLGANVPTVFGHSGARQVDGVGAFYYGFPDLPESFSSLGPVSIYFDDNGNRLASPEIRLQPTVLGPDGVVTTLSADNNLNPFFGTSASAPHAAGVAALLLQAAGGPGSLSAADVRGLLAAAAPARDLDPFRSMANLNNGGDTSATLTAAGDDTDSSAFSTRFFTLTFNGAAGSRLTSLTVDLGPAGLQFDPNPDTGVPFAIGQTSGGVNAAGVTAGVSSTGDGQNNVLTLTFATGAFPGGGTLRFGIDRDFVGNTAGVDNSADYLAGAVVNLGFANAQDATGTISGTLQNQVGFDYSPASGFGNILAADAINVLRGR